MLEFIFLNFPAVAECQEFLNLESQKVEQRICSNEIVVSSDENIFTIIVKWIEQTRAREKRSSESNFVTCQEIIYRVIILLEKTHKLVLQNFSYNMLVYEAIKRKNRHSRRHYF